MWALANPRQSPPAVLWVATGARWQALQTQRLRLVGKLELGRMRKLEPGPGLMAPAVPVDTQLQP